jgi:hypothetical protein
MVKSMSGFSMESKIKGKGSTIVLSI